MELKLRTYGDPLLREKSVRILEVTEGIRELVDQMLAIMRQHNGVGLAAEQVGRNEALFVLDIPPELDCDESGQRLHPEVQMPMVFINPEITESSKETEACEEGCLSFPGLYVPVVRPVDVCVHYMDLDGCEGELSCRALLARAIQHELDHLSGKLLTDRISYVKKIALSGRLKKMARETRASLSA